MEPEANVPFYIGGGFQNATEIGNKSTIFQPLGVPSGRFGRFLVSYERILKDIFATLHRQRTNNEKSAPVCHPPCVLPRRMGPEPPYFLPEFLHRRRPSRQLGPRHLPGQRRPYMVMYARRYLHVRRPAFQAARRRFLRHPGRPGDEPGGGSAASPVVHHHARHRLPRPHDRRNPHRPPQHLRRPRRRGRHRGGPQRIRLVRQRGHLLLGPLARSPPSSAATRSRPTATAASGSSPRPATCTGSTPSATASSGSIAATENGSPARISSRTAPATSCPPPPAASSSGPTS